MASIYELLAGQFGDENRYLAEDPFFMGGRALTQMGLPRATTNAEAILGPALLGLSSGLLTGYGRRHANESAWADAQTNPILNPRSQLIGPLEQAQQLQVDANPYAGAEMPPGWNMHKGRNDYLMALLQGESAQEQAVERIKQEGELTKLLAGMGVVRTPEGGVVPIAGLSEAQGNAAGYAAEQKALAEKRIKGGGIPGVPEAQQAQAQKEIQTVAQKQQSLEFIDKKFKEAKDLTGVSSALSSVSRTFGGPPTAKGAALEGIGEAIVFQIDKALGKEINSDVRTRTILSLAPKWWDSPEEIARKDKDMKSFVSSLFDATPILDSIPAASGGATLTKPSPNQFSSFAEFKAAKDAWRAAGGQ